MVILRILIVPALSAMAVSPIAPLGAIPFEATVDGNHRGVYFIPRVLRTGSEGGSVGMGSLEEMTLASLGLPLSGND